MCPRPLRWYGRPPPGASTGSIILSGNTITGNGIFFTPDGDTGVTTISGNSVTDNGYGDGILIAPTSDTGITAVSNNFLTSNNNGIRFESSNGGTTVTGNTISGSITAGVYFSEVSSSGNTISNNNFNNTANLISESGSLGANFWNIAVTAGTNIIGGPSQGGNFWGSPDGTGFSQTSPDSDKDGFCDAPYTLGTDNVDNLPLHAYTLVPPVANFTSNVTSGKVPLSVQFNDTSTGSPTSWSWDFGDLSAVSTTRNATHVYTEPGIYTVNLTATNSDGSNSTSKAGYVTVTNLVLPVVNFTSDVTSGLVPLSVQFNDTSARSPTSWSWDFGDSSPVNTTRNATHVYTQPGSYTVNLTATNNDGSNSTSKAGYITVTSQAPPSPTSAITAGFYAFGHVGQAPYSVRFLDQSAGSPIAWK